MPNRSHGQKPQERARRLLELLLDYENGNLKVGNKIRKELKANWDNSKLIVLCTLQVLVELTESTSSDSLTKSQVEEAIAFFEKYLEILVNNSKQGSSERKLEFNLCSTDKSINLENFDNLCKIKDSQKQVNKRNEAGLEASSIENLEIELSMGLASSNISSDKLLQELRDFRNKYNEATEEINKQKQVIKILEKKVEKADSRLGHALFLLVVLAAPLQLLGGAAYNHLTNISHTNKSPSNSVNKNDSSTSASSSDLSNSSNIQLQNPSLQSNLGKDKQCP